MDGRVFDLPKPDQRAIDRSIHGVFDHICNDRSYRNCGSFILLSLSGNARNRPVEPYRGPWLSFTRQRNSAIFDVAPTRRFESDARRPRRWVASDDCSISGAFYMRAANKPSLICALLIDARSSSRSCRIEPAADREMNMWIGLGANLVCGRWWWWWRWRLIDCCISLPSVLSAWIIGSRKVLLRRLCPCANRVSAMNPSSAKWCIHNGYYYYEDGWC